MIRWLMRTAFLAPVLLAALALGGCSGTAPSLTLTEAYIAERAADGGPVVVHVVVRADNPTPEPLAMWATAYSAASSGGVERWAQATAPPRGTVVFEIPLVVGAGEGGSSLSVSGKVDYVPGGRFRELLSELDVPLPSTSFAGSVPVDWSAAPRAPGPLRVGGVRTATVLDPGPPRAADTLPPLRQTP